MGVGIGCEEHDGPGQNPCLVGTTRPFFASIAGKRVQGRQANASVGIVQHRHQVVHRLLRDEMVEEQAAVMAHIGALIAQAFPDGRERVETGAHQGAQRRASMMGNRQLVE